MEATSCCKLSKFIFAVTTRAKWFVLLIPGQEKINSPAVFPELFVYYLIKLDKPLDDVSYPFIAQVIGMKSVSRESFES
jgi:hypothetical protein